PENPWRASLLWGPVYVGAPESAAPDEALRGPSSTPTDVTIWGNRALDLYDEARVRAGKPKLMRDGRLTALAQERSEQVARAGRELPPDVVLADKVAAAGFPPHEYDENHARVDSIADYVFLRLLLPSARRRLIDANTLVVGVGVSLTPPSAKG